MEPNTELNKRKPLSKRNQWILIVAIIIAIFYFMTNDNNTPDGFSEEFYEGAVETYYSLEEIMWNNQEPLSEDLQNWMMEYIFEAENQDYSAAEMKAVAAFKDYQYIIMLKPLEGNATQDPEWYPAYTYAQSELLKALELE